MSVYHILDIAYIAKTLRLNYAHVYAAFGLS